MPKPRTINAREVLIGKILVKHLAHRRTNAYLPGGTTAIFASEYRRVSIRFFKEAASDS